MISIIKKACFILILFGIADFALAQKEQPPTNLQVLQKLYLESFQSALQSAGIADSCDLYFVNSGTRHDLNWLVNEQFIIAAKSIGHQQIYQLYAFTSERPVKGYKAEIRPLETSVEYSAGSTRLHNKWLRTVTINNFIQIIAPDQRLVLSETSQKAGVDTILVKQKEKLENFDLPFTLGRQPKSFLSTLLEPALVTVITGVVVYIFYSFRSK